MAIIDFGGTKEEVITRKEFSMAKARKVLKNETIAIIGYGVQGPAQGLNLRDNGFKVIVGQAKAFQKDWDRAVKDGWVPGKTLFDIEEAVQKATIIQILVSDAAQRKIWPLIKANLKDGDALYFSSGSIFRLVLPADGSSFEVVLLAGSVAVAADGDLVVRTTTGVADIGSTISVVAYAPGASSSPGTLVVRTTKGSARVTPIAGKVTTVEKSTQLVIPAAPPAASEALQPTQVVAVNAAVSGDVSALRSASAIPAWATPRTEVAPKAAPPAKAPVSGRSLDPREP